MQATNSAGSGPYSSTVTATPVVPLTPVAGSTYRYSAKSGALKPDGSAASANNDIVATWTNLGSDGSLRNAIQETSAARPVIKSNQFGTSNPGLYFGLSLKSLYLSVDATIGSGFGLYTIVLLFRADTTSIDTFLLSTRVNTSGRVQTMRYDTLSSSGNALFRCFNGSNLQLSLPSPNNAATTNPYIVIYRRAGHNEFLRMRVNGTNLGPSGQVGFQMSFGQIGALGGIGPSSGVQVANFNGSMAELFIYNSDLTDVECVQMEAYFAQQWLA